MDLHQNPQRGRRAGGVVKALPPQKEPSSYGVPGVGLRCDAFDTFNNGPNGRFKELFHLFPEGGRRSDWTSGARGTTYPCKHNFPALTPQRASLSRGDPNLTKLGLSLSEKTTFSPVSKLSVKAARSCSLSNLESLNFAGGEKIRRANRRRKQSRAYILRALGP